MARPAAGSNGDPASIGFELTGGALCLDFANTVDNRPTDSARELLPDYGHLLAWAVQAEVLSEAAAMELRARSNQSRAESARTMERARELREAIFAVFSAAARSEPPPVARLRTLNEAVRRALGQVELQPAKDSYRWSWRERPGLEFLLWPIARSAADLLTAPELARVRLCDAANCDWLFLDKSKNRTRRWCDMKVCGNRDKARRYRAAKTPSHGARRARRPAARRPNTATTVRPRAGKARVS